MQGVNESRVTLLVFRTMLAAITKPLEAIVAADLRELAQKRWPESENIEYKGELHRGQDNKPDAWYSGGNLSRASQEKIFKELVAFANTSGGRLFLGIGETRERPPCADAILPIPRCADLAKGLSKQSSVALTPLLRLCA